MNLKEIWELSQDDIKEHIGTTSYDTWFNTLNTLVKEPSTLVIETPDEFFRNWIVDHYKPFIEKSIKKRTEENFQVEFVVNNAIVYGERTRSDDEIERSLQPIAAKFTSPLNARFTFDNFVVGSSNRFACAAGLAVAESPSKAYNPLFVYGKVGLGKTHLIQAITHKLRELHPHLKISYLSSEKFTNELIDSIRNRSTQDFRKKYREIDVLLIDDIHFIAGKESTQEEFFHTFNFLHENKKQIIITSDRPPKDINKLEERLSSRFAWGLITDIQPPDFETRVAILRKKAEFEKAPVPDDVINYIAEEVKTNTRELEGALVRVTAYSLLEEKPITLESAKVILKDMVKENNKIISIEQIQKSVASFYSISLTDLRAKSRNKNIVRPRQIAMYLSRKLTNMSFPEIGSAFGGKDHTTVLHSCRKIEKEAELDNMIKNSLEQLTTTLQQ